jgi:hypothetical protein
VVGHFVDDLYFPQTFECNIKGNNEIDYLPLFIAIIEICGVAFC